MADGTAQQCGRVGSCHILLKKPSSLFWRAFLFYLIARVTIFYKILKLPLAIPNREGNQPAGGRVVLYNNAGALRQAQDKIR